MKGKRGQRAAVLGLSTVGLAAGLWLASAGKASGGPPEPPPDDGVPSGTVAFFSGGTCPTDWTIAAEAQGRLIAGVTVADHAGVKVGDPLGDREERPHQHAYKGSVMLPDKALSAADGSNNSGAAAKSYDLMGSTTKDTSDLPFVQVQACAKP